SPSSAAPASHRIRLHDPPPARPQVAPLVPPPVFRANRTRATATRLAAGPPAPDGPLLPTQMKFAALRVGLPTAPRSTSTPRLPTSRADCSATAGSMLLTAALPAGGTASLPAAGSGSKCLQYPSLIHKLIFFTESL